MTEKKPTKRERAKLQDAFEHDVIMATSDAKSGWKHPSYIRDAMILAGTAINSCDDQEISEALISLMKAAAYMIATHATHAGAYPAMVSMFQTILDEAKVAHAGACERFVDQVFADLRPRARRKM